MEFTDDPGREKLVRWLHSTVYDPALVTEELIEQKDAWESVVLAFLTRKDAA